jgi:two-component system, OmpR family, sensor histidine kinase BaeS
MQARAAVAGVRLTRELAPAVIEGDPTRLHQIVTNLLSNAVKFTPADGTVEVRVNRERQRARLVVSDTGSGIGTDELPHVFDRFWRGRQAAEATEGTGIGLSIVAELVAAHDGDISVDSPPGEGTTVTVTFPLSPGVGPRFST